MKRKISDRRGVLAREPALLLYTSRSVFSATALGSCCPAAPPSTREQIDEHNPLPDKKRKGAGASLTAI